MNARDMQTIRGYVQSLPTASGRDDPVRVLVLGDDGRQFRVLHRGAGVGLLGDINARVEVTGSVTSLAPDDPETGEAVCCLEVKRYRLIDGFDDPWYDDAVI